MKQDICLNISVTTTKTTKPLNPYLTTMKNKFLNLNRNAMIYLVVIGIAFAFNACKPRTGGKADGSFVSADAAQAVYVAPGSYDEFYCFMSGGFSGQVTIYG
jgi:nitrous-oxide reductase